MVDIISSSAVTTESPKVSRDSANGISSSSARSAERTPTDDFDTPGGIRTLLYRIVRNFPVVPGKKGLDPIWTTEVLRRIDPELPLPSGVARKAMYSGRKEIPALLYQIAATLGTYEPAERREKSIMKLVTRAADGKDPALAMREFAEILGAADSFSAYAHVWFHQENRPEFLMARFILSAATVCFALARMYSYGEIPVYLRTVLGSFSYNPSLSVREALSIIQTATNEANSDTPLDFYEFQTLFFGEKDIEDQQGENNGEEEKNGKDDGERREEKKITFLNDYSLIENTILGLLTRREEKDNATPDPERELATLFHNGTSYVDDYNRLLFADLGFLPSPVGVLEQIQEHARYALWPGVNEVYWKEGPLRRVRLLPLSDGKTRAAVELECDDALRVFLREIPGRNDKEEWGHIVDNYRTTTGMGYTDPICAAVEAFRVCVVASERKIAPGTVRRVPEGYVRGERKPRSGDVVLRYVPRYLPSGDSGQKNNGVPSVSLARGSAKSSVVGHLRQIPKTHKASEECRRAAEAVGIPLPNTGTTFVRPHTRGAGENDVSLKKVRMSGAVKTD